MPARSAVVTGRVQGVGFRAYVRDLALDLGVRGEVWNRTDGAVEVVFEHEDKAVLDEFSDRLGSGPGAVASVRSGPTAAESWLGFRVGPTRPPR
jgi:acylphosphatase